MASTCLRDFSSFLEPARHVFQPLEIVADVEKMMRARIDSKARELFERSGSPAKKEWHYRMEAEREVFFARTRLIECAESVTLFAYLPEVPGRRLTIFLTSRSIAIRSRIESEAQPANSEQFLIARWATEIDPHTAFASLDGTHLSIMGWCIFSPRVKNRFKLWTLPPTATGALHDAENHASVERGRA